MLLVMNQSSIIPFSNRKRDNTPLQISSSKLRERVRRERAALEDEFRTTGNVSILERLAFRLFSSVDSKRRVN